MKITESAVFKIDTIKTETPLADEQETGYCFLCGGLQPVFIPEEEREEEEE